MGDNTFDRSLLFPLVLAVLAALGIAVLLLGLRLSGRQAPSASTETATALQFQFLATEPAVVTLPPKSSPTATLSPTAFEFVVEDTPTMEGVVDFFTTTPVLGGSLASPSATALTLGRTFDDTDFALNYSGSWIGQSGVNGVYQNTLHLSNVIGNAVQLSFVGQKIRLVYQAGPSLGAVSILLDSVDFTIDQEADETQLDEWESPLLVLSSHTITITHISGGSINIDMLVVVDVTTPTPTLTPTP